MADHALERPRSTGSVKTDDRSQMERRPSPSIEATLFGMQAAYRPRGPSSAARGPDFLPEAVSARCKALVGLS